MDNAKKISHLVVDTAGFIKNEQFQVIANNIYTTESVINEIKSHRQARSLAVLPYTLQVKEPSQEGIAFVTEFSKKTGDYNSLSATDIQVLALTYQLEKEYVGIEHLRDKPVQKPTINPRGLPSQEFKEIPGFYNPQVDDEEDNEEQSENDGHDVVLKLDDLTVNEKNSNTCDNVASENEGSSEFEDESDNDGWITPKNIKQLKSKLMSEVEEEKTPQVGCMTTDFAMQNVLKQIGLNVIALDGRVIKEIRSFILRCYTCYKTTSDMRKVFCPKCGNKCLKKVAVTTNPDGTMEIYINYRRPLTARGKKFSLPTPKGGKHANNPLLCEDQPLPQQRGSRLSRKKNNPLDDDYIAGYSPFVTRDVSSRSAMLGIRPHSQMKQIMRKNPNESVKPGGRKRK